MFLKKFNGRKEGVKSGFFKGMLTLDISIVRPVEGKKKCSIFSLEDGDKIITEEKELREHIESYYKNLFGPKELEVFQCKRISRALMRDFMQRRHLNWRNLSRWKR